LVNIEGEKDPNNRGLREAFKFTNVQGIQRAKERKASPARAMCLTLTKRKRRPQLFPKVVSHESDSIEMGQPAKEKKHKKGKKHAEGITKLSTRDAVGFTPKGEAPRREWSWTWGKPERRGIPIRRYSGDSDNSCLMVEPYTPTSHKEEGKEKNPSRHDLEPLAKVNRGASRRKSAQRPRKAKYASHQKSGGGE